MTDEEMAKIIQAIKDDGADTRLVLVVMMGLFYLSTMLIMIMIGKH